MKSVKLALRVFLMCLTFLPVTSVAQKGDVEPSPQVEDDTAVVVVSKVKVDLSTQTLELLDGQNKPVKTVKIQSGKAETPTPTGKFKVAWKKEVYPHKGSRLSGGKPLDIPFWLNLEGKDSGDEEIGDRGIGIHFFDTTFGGVYPSSQGCIRIIDKAGAKAVFDLVAEKTPVEVTGSAEEYIQKNAPGLEPEVLNLFSNPDAGIGKYILKRPGEFDEEMKKTLRKLIQSHRAGFYAPKGVKDKSKHLCGIPGAQPDPGKLGYDKATEIYLTRAQVDSLLRP